MRHTRPWVYYQGTSTVVPISIFGRTSLPAERTIALQRRGWRTGLLGWTIGAWVGGTVGKDLDVTPAAAGSWDALDSKRRGQYDKEIRTFLESAAAPKDHHPLETALVHVPVAAGDGYFRMLIKGPSGRVLAQTASFRVGSLSLSSAHPRGASVVTVLPELALKSASLTVNTAAWAAFYTAFPLLKAAQMMPGTHAWGTWALRRAYTMAGGEQTAGELKERYRVEERRMRAEDAVYRTVPFGSVGVRTAYDLEQDAKMGKGGVYFPRDIE
ncbi:hypothetical protein B0H15DRAFT_794681 [Mycena belliarum]|uniref:Uncharacterized protein n=1 Tax=Mycena belliarum TaxID=1033014 RepID=A0AAD6XFI4_9AGAR|nr:hypothetical protein B0H15DRAFT_794681 [Mycena belliae]